MPDDRRERRGDGDRRGRAESLTASVEETLDALALGPEDQGLAALARLTATAIDQMDPATRGKMAGQVVPALQRVLAELGQRRRPVEQAQGSALDRLRARACLRDRTGGPRRLPNGRLCGCATCRLRVLVGPEVDVDEGRVLPPVVQSVG